MEGLVTENNLDRTTVDWKKRNWYEFVLGYVEGNHNNTDEMSKPHLRHTFAGCFEFVIFAYLLISICGIVVNSIEIYFIIKYRLYKDATYIYLINLSLSDLVKCLFVLPFSVIMLLLQNWLLGNFLCYFIPMLQDVPTHVTVLTMLMTVFDRYTFLKSPNRSRLPGFIFSSGTWLTAICVVLPYPIYTTYIDLEMLLKVNGVGLCLFNLEKDIREYNRAISISLFVIPAVATTYLFTQMAQIIEKSDETIIVRGFEIHLKGSLRRYYSRRFSNDPKRNRTSNGNSFLNNYAVDPKVEEKRIQKFLIAICAIFGLCFGSFLILRVIHQLNEEDYTNTGHWDVMYCILMWIAYLPSITTPLLVIMMIIRSEDISDLRNYIRMKRRSIFQRVDDDEETSQMMSVTYTSRPSATTISTDFGIQQERSI